MPVVKPIIEIEHLGFAYGSYQVLEDVSVSINYGDYVGIIGPNGGGKTTLLKILLGLLPVQSGTVRIFGRPLGGRRYKQQLGYVPQRVAQEEIPFPATVYEVVASGQTSRRRTASATRQALGTAGISQLARRQIRQLSGGQRQRVYIARALARQPQVLLLDEPFVGVDAAAQRDFYAFLRRLNTEHKLTILFITHDIDVVAQEAKSILCLNRGLLCYGHPDMLHRHDVQESLYGKPVTHLHH